MQDFISEHGFGPGSIIEYTAFGGLARRVKVTEVEHDVKNGRPGFSGTLVEPADEFEAEHGGVWGYCSQVTRIVQVAS